MKLVPKPVFRPKTTPAAAPAHQKSSEEEYDTDDSEEEESEEEEAPKPLLKPIFQSKKQRETGSVGAAVATSGATEHKEGEDEEEAKARAQAEARRKESHNLAAEHIKREHLEAAAAKEHQTDVDDTDGLDPDAEFQAWRIRELERIKRDREAASRQEEEREEVEKRRAMPESQRLREDMERAKKQREEKSQNKGNVGFMQKYYHKGSFFQDLDILKKRDYSEATESAVDKSMLPKVMQVRDYGKASRSKWTHLANEDTSKRQEDPRFKGMSRQDSDRSQHDQGRRDDRNERRGGPDDAKTGANRSALGSDRQRSWGSRGDRRRSRSPDQYHRRREEANEYRRR